MVREIASLTVLVADYDAAIDFYTRALGFDLVEDSDLGEGKRWVRVAPPGSAGVTLLLAKAANRKQRSRIGDQTGGRVFLFLNTDDFWGDYERMQKQGVQFLEEPRHETYGWVVVFQDLYGNRWDLIQPFS